jgi:hypothetical protein
MTLAYAVLQIRTRIHMILPDRDLRVVDPDPKQARNYLHVRIRVMSSFFSSPINNYIALNIYRTIFEIVE